MELPHVEMAEMDYMNGIISLRRWRAAAANHLAQTETPGVAGGSAHTRDPVLRQARPESDSVQRQSQERDLLCGRKHALFPVYHKTYTLQVPEHDVCVCVCVCRLLAVTVPAEANCRGMWPDGCLGAVAGQLLPLNIAQTLSGLEGSMRYS